MQMTAGAQKQEDRKVWFPKTQEYSAQIFPTNPTTDIHIQTETAI